MSIEIKARGGAAAWPTSLLLGLTLAAGCREHPTPARRSTTPSSKPAPPRPPPKPDPDALPAASGLAPGRRAIQVVNGEERQVDAELARQRGQTVVDLGDEWAPSIFQDATAADGTLLPNRYRAVFVGLASDRSDGDGQPLPAGSRNFLELYGIPPSLSVLRARFLADADRTCDVDAARLMAVDGVEVWGATTEKKELARRTQRATRLETARAAGGFATLEELAQATPRLARDVQANARFQLERAAFAEIEKRLACEGLMDPAKHQAGSYDSVMRFAMLDFQQKNVIPAQGDITAGTLEALTRSVEENNLGTLRRVLTERAAHAGGFLEDGSVMPPVRPGKPRREPTYLGADGQRHPVPDLVGQATQALMDRLGLGTAADALAFFRRHPAADFHWLKAAVRFPLPPEYYGPQMDLFAEIDRGDVWYDFPFDQAGQRLSQLRNHFPALTLYVRWRGEKVPLLRWRTTVGGWRSELASDGEEYFRYKGSDVGPRLWRHIVTAPVWIPPPSTPLGGMVKTKWVNGTLAKVVNYDETGPGYLSAYGLVAAIHVLPIRKGGEIVGYFDNGIRTHGSFDYMSLRGRFSHGCHRLSNNLAVRLFSFVLGHRQARRLGAMALDFRQTFFQEGEVFEMRLPNRGFYFELDPPIPVETLEGNIKGALKKPMAGYVRKPGLTYTTSAIPPVSGDPETKAAGAAEAP